MTEVDELLMNGKLKEAMESMRSQPGYEEEMSGYVDLFVNKNYRKYEVSERLNEILETYQEYFREVFYCGTGEEQAAIRLMQKLCFMLSVSEADEDVLAEQLQEVFQKEGYHALFGKTQGYFGPYVWKDTVPTSYQVELPDGVEEYTVNILKGFIFRSWMDYLTFGKHGAGGWASSDGTLNCIECAYDFESEKFTVHFLKHEAQHARDMREYPDMTSTELEYRAKLVELCYASDPELLSRFIRFADENKTHDSHAMASVRIKEGFSGRSYQNVADIKERAFELFSEDSEKWRKQKFDKSIHSCI